MDTKIGLTQIRDASEGTIGWVHWRIRELKAVKERLRELSKRGEFKRLSYWIIRGISNDFFFNLLIIWVFYFISKMKNFYLIESVKVFLNPNVRGLLTLAFFFYFFCRSLPSALRSLFV